MKVYEPSLIAPDPSDRLSDLSELVRRLEGELGPADGPPVALSGGITNRNYRLRLGGRDCVLRLPGQDTGLLGIDRVSERLAAERAASLGIGPQLLHADAECMRHRVRARDRRRRRAAACRPEPGRARPARLS